MCIFDLDDTLDLTDRRLTVEFLKLDRLGVNFITATGRTNSYVLETCKKNNIMLPKFIISDNGGLIYDVTQKRYIKRTTLEAEKRKVILKEYLRLGGLVENIRYTDGDFVYAAADQAIREYYRRESSIEYRTNEEIINGLLDEENEITKITLAGKKDIMKKLSKAIKEKGVECFPDGGETKFPKKSRNNYRLDITDGRTSKGEGVEFLVNYTGIKDFTCIGNGPNDFSMFKFALDSGMPVVVVRTMQNGKITEESRELIKRVKEYAESIGRGENVTITNFPANGLIGKREERKSIKQRRKAFVQEISVPKEVTSTACDTRINQRNIRRTQDRGK